ncbi:MAG: 1-deoxy-D-xylulose-5-phosphate reductoisomerase [Pseudomonadales bacterium]|nr:1-deoxy-D-xylulose-5-phosphate reductoisomerase [Pseudomonadales bacterium]
MKQHHRQDQQAVTILGSTGSIGANTLLVIAEHPERYRVFALTANTRVDVLFRQCLDFKPRFAVMSDVASADCLRQQLHDAGSDTEVLSGEQNLNAVACAPEVDCVMAAIVGGAGLLPGLAAARAGKKLLLANKEALVMAGDLFMAAVIESGATLLPIDSEHNAIFQCLPIDLNGRFANDPNHGFAKIVLTASGGPFLTSPLSEMAAMTPAQACAHPNWKMGPKISVDSATMLNKSLELIEACILFDTPANKVEIVIHPQSIVHSMVHYKDGSVLAQMGNPDMRTPISYGLAWPERISSGVAPLDLVAAARLDFLAPDENRFPCLRLGRQAAEARGTTPVILNAANEVAVAAFLDQRISFTEIPAIIADTLSQQPSIAVDKLETVLLEDAKARRSALKFVEQRSR